MSFNPSTREVTIVFEEIGKSLVGKKPIWRRAGFNLVSDAGSADRFVEPVNACLSADILTGCTVLKTPEQMDRIVGIEYIRGPMFAVHSFSPSYYDVG